ncbi:MAG: DUF5110 domain-containing protein [Duncaniella sp.]|nr:DUF5110 domain-containing protein [Duncaniella sp.]
MLKKLCIIISLISSLSAMARVASVYPVSDGIEYEYDGVKTRLRVITPKIIRVSSTPGEFPPDSSLIVLPHKSGVYHSLETTPDGYVLSTSEVKARMDASTGAVSFFDKDGKLILAESDGGRSFTLITVEGTEGYTVSQTFESIHDDEGIYGLGQHQANEFNYKGKNESLFQYNTKVSVPFVVSTDNYGLLWDSYSLCRWGNPDDYSTLGEVFTLYDENGVEGALTGRYVAADSTVMVRREPVMSFEYLERPELKFVTVLPHDFKFKRSAVTYSGEIEPLESGRYDFQLYYSGYITVYAGDRRVVDTRWRTSWNPNAYKFSLDLEKGKRVPLKIEWHPDGDVAYCGLRVYPAADERESGRMRWWGEMQDAIDYYFIYGDDMDDVIAGYRDLTGRAPIMPKWAMGYWQSREKYNTADEVLTTLREFRRRDIPIDNIVIDWLHWPQDAWGSHEFDRKRFPDPKGMVDSIHALDARVMVSVWPKFYTTTDHYKEFDTHGWMYRNPVRDSIRDWVGPGYLGSFYDAYHPEARKLFWSQVNDHYVPLGIDAWWMDASEPNIRDCVDIEYRKELMTPTALGPAAKYFNAYALMNAEAIYDGQRADVADKRVFLLTRSGFPGQQRYSTATWSGDIATRWEDMEAQIRAGLNFSVSGIPFWTMDIGGFCVEDRYVKAAKAFDKTGLQTDDLDEWRELNTRWYQFGAFVPLFRAHGQWPFREVYNIAPEDHPAYNSIVYYTRLRYNLMPYLYSLAAMAHYDDYTLMRPMVMDFTSDLTVRGIGDQYMFGPAFLVAPVYRFGARSRQVYFPAGETWYDFYTGRVIDGTGKVMADAPYDRLPLFVRGGSIIPAGPDIKSTAEVNDDPVTILVYAGRDGHFTLYDDEGVNYNYEQGKFSKIPLTYDDASATLTIGKREGEYDGMRENCTFNIVYITPSMPVDNAVKADGRRVDYSGNEINIKL